MDFLIVLAIIAIIIIRKIKTEEKKRQAQQRASQAAQPYRPEYQTRQPQYTPQTRTQYSPPAVQPAYMAAEDPRFPDIEQDMKYKPQGGLREGESDVIDRTQPHTLSTTIEVSLKEDVRPKEGEYIPNQARNRHVHEETSITGFEECPPESKAGYSYDAYNISERNAAVSNVLKLDFSKNALIQGIIYAEILKKPKALRR